MNFVNWNGSLLWIPCISQLPHIQFNPNLFSLFKFPFAWVIRNWLISSIFLFSFHAQPKQSDISLWDSFRSSYLSHMVDASYLLLPVSVHLYIFVLHAEVRYSLITGNKAFTLLILQLQYWKPIKLSFTLRAYKLIRCILPAGDVTNYQLGLAVEIKKLS